jgi:hypothetical protein
MRTAIKKCYETNLNGSKYGKQLHTNTKEPKREIKVRSNETHFLLHQNYITIIILHKCHNIFNEIRNSLSNQATLIDGMMKTACSKYMRKH